MRSSLDWTNTVNWIYIVLSHWNNSPRVDVSLHSDTLYPFIDNQSLILLINAACLVEKQQIPILPVIGLNGPGLENMIYHTRDEHANHYITGPVVSLGIIDLRR